MPLNDRFQPLNTTLISYFQRTVSQQANATRDARTHRIFHAEWRRRKNVLPNDLATLHFQSAVGPDNTIQPTFGKKHLYVQTRPRPEKRPKTDQRPMLRRQPNAQMAIRRELR